MAHWLLDIENERRRADEARKMHHDARLRTSARRIAGIALAEHHRLRTGAGGEDSFIVLLNACATDQTVPEPVRAAAQRLMARVGSDFSSPSVDPIGDAETIVTFVISDAQKS
jgi:hypothetical protein